MQAIHGLHSASTNNVSRFAPGESVGTNDGMAGKPFQTQTGSAPERSMDAPNPHATPQSHGSVGLSRRAPIDLIGYGYITQRVAARLDGEAVSAFSRRFENKHPDCTQIRCYQTDLDQPPEDLAENLSDGIWVYSVPPGGTQQTDDRLRAFLSAAASIQPRAIIYLGTSGVYGNTDGGWVDENSPTRPGNNRSMRRLDAESQLAAFAQRGKTHLYRLRITGIYAANRLPIERIKSGKPIICDAEAPWSNRIHADDLTEIIIRLINRSNLVPTSTPESEILNISDNNPDKPTTLYQLTAQHHRLPMPKRVSIETALANATPMAAEFLRESRRVDARKVQKFLDWQPRYPDLNRFFEQLT